MEPLDYMDPEPLKFGAALEVFCDKLEEDGVDSVSLELVKSRWIPEALALESKVERMERAVEEAYPFVESAGHADNTGGEYLPHCQECEPFIGDRHTKDCPLNAWLEKNKGLAQGDDGN